MIVSNLHRENPGGNLELCYFLFRSGQRMLEEFQQRLAQEEKR